MHELPITQNILEIALRHAEKAGATRITGLNLVIGQLASMVDDSIQFYWDIIASDTPAQGAKLNFRRIPAEMLCQQCNFAFPPTGDEFACPNCGSTSVRVNAGNEFFLESIEVDV
jgi:hydrogenase nickel incorporation protein HypA/HybF